MADAPPKTRQNAIVQLHDPEELPATLLALSSRTRSTMPLLPMVGPSHDLDNTHTRRISETIRLLGEVRATVSIPMSSQEDLSQTGKQRLQETSSGRASRGVNAIRAPRRHRGTAWKVLQPFQWTRSRASELGRPHQGSYTGSLGQGSTTVDQHAERVRLPGI